MKINNKLARLCALYVGALAFFVFMNPEKMPLVLLLVPFLLVFVVLYQTSLFLIEGFFSLRPQPKRTIALIVSAMPVVLLVIQSITQLNLRDVLISVTIVIILVWYIGRLN